jgi:hypothetical protein
MTKVLREDSTNLIANAVNWPAAVIAEGTVLGRRDSRCFVLQAPVQLLSFGECIMITHEVVLWCQDANKYMSRMLYRNMPEIVNQSCRS